MTALADVARQPQQQQPEPVSIVFPSSAVSEVIYWPDGIELSLLCAARPHWSTVSFDWYKDDVPIVSSQRWRYYVQQTHSDSIIISVITNTSNQIFTCFTKYRSWCPYLYIICTAK